MNSVELTIGTRTQMKWDQTFNSDKELIVTTTFMYVPLLDTIKILLENYNTLQILSFTLMNSK